MTHSPDFVARSHSLWRMRLAQLQQRFRFFWQLTLGCSVAGSLIVMQFVVTRQDLFRAAQCLFAKFVALIGELAGRDIEINISVAGEKMTLFARLVAEHPMFTDALDLLVFSLLKGAAMGLILGMCASRYIQIEMSLKGSETLADRVLGGTRVVSGTELARLAVPGSSQGLLHIGPVPIPRNIETRHFAIIGTTGSGKTTVLRQMLDDIEQRGDPALVYDTSGEFVAHYFNPARGDIILNPFDGRCVVWSPFDEIAHPADADRIARQLVAETGSEDDDVWLETSRILVANMLRSLWAEKNCNLEALLEALQVKSKEQLKQWLGHTSSARTFADDADRATGSVLFMLAKAANLIQFLRVEDDGRERFAFRDFIAGLDARKGPKPWIFVPRKEDHFEAAKPLMACWLECAASAVLGLPPSPERRLWFVLDELADLPRVENLARLLPEGRKFGSAADLPPGGSLDLM